MSMTFVQLKYILTIAETKSLNKAAEQLYVSQPSLTNALKELEKEVGDFAKWNDKYLVKMHKSGNGEYEKIIAFIVVSC